MTDTDSQTLLPTSKNLFTTDYLEDSLYKEKPAINQHLISPENKDVMQAIEALKTESLLGKTILFGDKPLEECLFDARAKVKIMTSAVSMHINPILRKKLFHQIDMLHEVDEWESEDIPVNESSFKSFLAAFVQINPERGPGLGLSYAGNLIASWVIDKNRLIIEFMPGKAKWIITRIIDGEPEHFTGNTKIARLLESLKPYDPEQWFLKNE